MAAKTKEALEAELAEALSLNNSLREENNRQGKQISELLNRVAELEPVAREAANAIERCHSLQEKLDAANEAAAMSPKVNPRLAELVKEKVAAGLPPRDALRVAQDQIAHEKNLERTAKQETKAEA